MNDADRERLKEELAAVFVHLTDEQFDRFVGVVESLRDDAAFQRDMAAEGMAASEPVE